MKKFISILLICVFILSSVSLCGCNKKYQPIMTYKNQSISTNIFTYILSQSKTVALYTLGKTEDTSEFWDTDSGIKLSDYIFEDATITALSMIYFAWVAEENGAVLSKEELNEIETNLESYMSGYNATKSAFNEKMAIYGVNYDILKDYYKLQKLAEKGKEYVIGTNGTNPITNDEYLKYYNENYVTLRHINLNNINKLGANGKEALLTEEEKAKVLAQADEVDAKIKEGADLSEFADLSSDNFLKSYPEGLTIPITNDLYMLAQQAEQNGKFNAFGLYYYLVNNVKGFADMAFFGKIGSVSRMESDKGIFFIQKLPLDMGIYEVYKDMMVESHTLDPQKIKEIITKMRAEGNFTIDQDLLATFSVKGAAMIDIPKSQPQE